MLGASAVSAKTISVLLSLLAFAIGGIVTGVIRRPQKIALLDRLPNTRDQELLEILNESSHSNTKYGKFHGCVIEPQLRRIPNSKQRLSRLFGINMKKLERDIYEAKLDDMLTPEEVLSMKLLGTIGMFVFVLTGIAMDFNLGAIFMGLMCYLFGGFLPQRIISQRIEGRRAQIEKELPDFLDLVASVTESGLVIQEALTKVTARTKGPLAEEFQAVMVETKASGGQWRVAMENMAFRNDIDSLSDVVSDILIAYEKGTSITDTLKKEAVLMRQLQNSQSQEKARGLSIKLIIPMAIFSFLPLLILLLAPMLIQFTEHMG